MNPITTNAKNDMQKALDNLRQEFNTVRTGKASPSLVENIVIKAYGGTAPLRVMELATISATDAHTLVITPFDQVTLHEIEKGIADAQVGLNPIVDGQMLRINLPPLSEERRREFVKVIQQKAENGKVTVRHARHAGMEAAKKMEDQDVSEDEIIRIEKEVQKLTDEFIEKIDSMSKEKEAELMKV